MLRSLMAVLAVLLAAVLWTPEAAAHGGQFRGPRGAVPPHLRPPTDPPPVPPQNPETPETPDVPDTGDPGNPVTPPTPPVPGDTTPKSPDTPVGSNPGRPGGRASSIDFSHWSFWWEHNKSAILGLKDAIYAMDDSAGGGFSPLGARRPGMRSDATHLIRSEIERRLLPTLHWVIHSERKLDPDIESAAYIALAKTARSPVEIELIKKALDPKAKKPQLVSESAALALGLLRRTAEDEQFLAGELDRVRDFLFDVVDNDKHRMRTHGFALFALGLLGDQPTGKAGSDAGARAMQTTTRLFEVLGRDWSGDEIEVATLIAIGLQPGDSFTDAQRDTLRELVLKSRGGQRPTVRAHAAQVLGRIGTGQDVGVLQRVLHGSKRGAGEAVVRRSAAIGLGTLATRVGSEERATLVEQLLKRMSRIKDVSARNFATISIAYHLVADQDAGSERVLANTKALPWLIETARKGKRADRTFAALALGLVARGIGEEAATLALGAARQESLETLRDGLQARDMTKRDVAAYATALGIARDARSLRALGTLVADRSEAPILRGYAATAIGMLGFASTSIRESIRDALVERRSQEMRIQCATSLGLLRDRKAVDLLLEEIGKARNQSTKGQLVLALARIGDERAVDPLVAMVRSDREQDLSRALACAALGVVGDLESVPSLTRISQDVNYRAHTELVDEVLTIL